MTAFIPSSRLMRPKTISAGPCSCWSAASRALSQSTAGHCALKASAPLQQAPTVKSIAFEVRLNRGPVTVEQQRKLQKYARFLRIECVSRDQAAPGIAL